MSTLDDLYQDWLDDVDETDTSALKAKFKRTCNRLNRMIQPIAGVEKTWEATVTAGTESYDTVASGMTDYYSAHEGRFLADGGTNELGNYSLWKVIKQFHYGVSGIWFDQAKTLYIRPKPADGGTLKVYGYKVLSDLDYSADLGAGEVATPEIDEDLHDVYTFYAAMTYGARDEDTEGSGSRHSIFKEKFEERRLELEMRFLSREASRRINRAASSVSDDDDW
jgi:hypothetical protein